MTVLEVAYKIILQHPNTGIFIGAKKITMDEAVDWAVKNNYKWKVNDGKHNT